MNRHMKSRRLRTAAASVALCATLGGTIVATERPAHAIDPVTITAWVELAYSVVKLGERILGLGGRGAEFTDELNRVRDEIIAAIILERNRSLISRVGAVHDNFRELVGSSPGATAATMYAIQRQEQNSVEQAIFDIIMAGSDSGSTLDLIPAYSSLIATGTATLAVRKEVDPANPSRWEHFYSWLQPGMNASYKAIGAQRHMCWHGDNPRYQPPPAFTTPAGYQAWLNRTVAGKYKESTLWKRLENRSIFVETWTTRCQVTGGSTFYTSSYNRLCNPGTRTCNRQADLCTLTTRTSRECASGVEPLACAEELAKPHFDANSVVKAVRAGMRSLQTLSGGNDFDAATNDSWMPFGGFVDPWVDEPSCGADQGPWAYAQLP